MRRTTVTVFVVALIAGLVGVALMPRVPRLGAQTTGDRDLAAAALSATPDPSGRRGLAVALVEHGRIRTAGLGDRDLAGRPVEPGTPFEIGSVTKALTGMLLADQVAAGVVGPDDRLGVTWPEVTGPARDVTLAELASHRAGLPRLAPGSPLGWARILWSNVSGANPYAGQGVDAIRSAADRVSTDDDERGEVHYSNLGPSVLGHALAAKAGVAYPELLHDRLLRPLGMTATIVATRDDDLPADRAQGSRAGGRPLDPWAGAGYAPAGAGPWSTAQDLGRLLAATLAGTAPGADAATARFREDDDTRIGYGWFTTRHGDREVVWHNGATGGFRSYVGLERATGRAVVVLGNTDKGVEPIGLRLLGVPPKEADGDGDGAAVDRRRPRGRPHLPRRPLPARHRPPSPPGPGDAAGGGSLGVRLSRAGAPDGRLVDGAGLAVAARRRPVGGGGGSGGDPVARPAGGRRAGAVASTAVGGEFRGRRRAGGRGRRRLTPRRGLASQPLRTLGR